MVIDSNLCQVFVAEWNVIARSLSADAFAQHNWIGTWIDNQFTLSLKTKICHLQMFCNHCLHLIDEQNIKLNPTLNVTPFNLLMFSFWHWTRYFTTKKGEMNIHRLMYQLHFTVMLLLSFIILHSFLWLNLLQLESFKITTWIGKFTQRRWKFCIRPAGISVHQTGSTSKAGSTSSIHANCIFTIVLRRKCVFFPSLSFRCWTSTVVHFNETFIQFWFVWNKTDFFFSSPCWLIINF